MRSSSRSKTGFGRTVLAIAAFTGGDCCFGAAAPADSVAAIDTVAKVPNATSFALTPSGAIFVLDGRIDQLLRLSSAGRIETAAGGKGSGSGGFDEPVDVAAPDEMQIYVADYGNNRIVRLDRSLGISSVFETPFDAPPVSDQVQFRYPISVAVTRFGKLLIVEGDYGRIIELDQETNVSRIFGGVPRGAAQLKNPRRIRIADNTTVYIHHDPGLAVFDVFGNYLRTLSHELIGRFRTFCTHAGMVYLLDSAAVRVIDERGSPVFSVPVPEELRAGMKDIQADGSHVMILAGDRLFRMPYSRPDRK